jgi:putative endonuclease
MWYVYILECSDTSLYTGITKDLEKRVDVHNKKSGSKAVRGKLPVKLVYYEEHLDHAAALRREYEIKQLKREDKLKLIKK